MPTKSNSQPLAGSAAKGPAVSGPSFMGRDTRYSIPVADLKTMIDKYKTDRQNPGSDSSGTRSVWFSITELKSFIAQAEKEGTTNKLNGIRMYFAAYPEKSTGESFYLKPIEDALRNKVTLVLIPTFLGVGAGSGLNVDFAPDVVSSVAVPLGGVMEDQETALAMNHGALCPPGCPPPSAYFNTP